ncbi:hypothetical protein AQUCO_00600238v1 [Aquilegia coerulea]|uniref:Uncharacterized protein n=1 Tax=Aquilegia coerulea TaxID=218851 RepID=A0A2G5ENN5_AQUCA|nr:hypothetical protein AQUCO_00600238v1 [Aquilegia coerulea]
MSRSESNTTPTISATDESQGTSDTRIKVDFNQHGKPIGRNAAKFSTRLGCLTRTHCPPIYAEWPDEGLKDNKLDLWKGIQAEFIVPEEYKDAQLVHANQLWKNWKSSLRRHCDKYSTINTCIGSDFTST